LDGRVVAAASPKPGNGSGEGLVRRRGRPPTGPGPLAIGAPALPHQLALLREVHEAEVQPERPDHDLGPLRFQRTKRGGERVAEGGLVASPEPDRCPADPLDKVEQWPALLLGDHLAEERAKQADLEGERIAAATGADPDGFGSNGFVRRRGAARARTR